MDVGHRSLFRSLELMSAFPILIGLTRLFIGPHYAYFIAATILSIYGVIAAITLGKAGIYWLSCGLAIGLRATLLVRGQQINSLLWFAVSIISLGVIGSVTTLEKPGRKFMLDFSILIAVLISISFLK